MKKTIILFLLFIIIIFIFIYQKENKINTDNINIKYPKTAIKKVDTEIKNYINEQVNYFKENYETDDQGIKQGNLIIEYTYKEINNRYLNTVLITKITNKLIDYPIYDIKTYTYDLNKENFVTLDNFISKDRLEFYSNEIKSILKKDYENCIIPEKIDELLKTEYETYQNFTFDNHTFTFYLLPKQLASDYYDIISIDIPLTKK